MNAGQALILKNIYQQTSDENKQRIDSLEQLSEDHFSSGLNKEHLIQSIAYGRSVARAIYEWSKTDGGHRGYLNNFDKEAVHPDRPGSWKPPLFAQSFSHLPLHPHWGNNRTFTIQNSGIPLPYMIPYDTLPGSPYYNEYVQVYEKDMVTCSKRKRGGHLVGR